MKSLLCVLSSLGFFSLMKVLVRQLAIRDIKNAGRQFPCCFLPTRCKTIHNNVTPPTLRNERRGRKWDKSEERGGENVETASLSHNIMLHLPHAGVRRKKRKQQGSYVLDHAILYMVNKRNWLRSAYPSCLVLHLDNKRNSN